MKKEKTLRPLRSPGRSASAKPGLCGEKFPGLPRSPRGFTLIELLVVISIIAILAGMVMPTFYYAKKRAREAKARVVVKQLETAFKAYLDTYKVWPDAVAEGTTYKVADDAGVNLFSMLRGDNPQGIAFFEFESVTNSAMNQTTAYDPWSDPNDSSSLEAYRVMFDKNYDNKIVIDGKDVYRCVAVWSFGEGRTNDNGGGDDVASWR